MMHDRQAMVSKLLKFKGLKLKILIFSSLQEFFHLHCQGTVVGDAPTTSRISFCQNA